MSGWLLAALYGLEQNPLRKGYAIRRFARIFPLLVLFLTIYIFLCYAINFGGFYLALHSELNTGITKRPEIIIFLTLTFTLFLSPVLWNTVIPGGWSIQSEVAHYILFPFVRRKRSKTVLLISAIVNLLSIILLLIQSKIDDSYSFLNLIIATWLRLGLFSTFTFFLFGVLGRCFYLQLDQSHNQDSIFGKELGLFALSSSIVICPMGTQIEANGYLGVNIILAISLVRTGFIRRLLTLLGRLSFFICFAHFLGLQVIQAQLKIHKIEGSIFSNQILIFFVIFLLTIACSVSFAIPSWKYVELPILNRIKQQN